MHKYNTMSLFKYIAKYHFAYLICFKQNAVLFQLLITYVKFIHISMHHTSGECENSITQTIFIISSTPFTFRMLAYQQIYKASTQNIVSSQNQAVVFVCSPQKLCSVNSIEFNRQKSQYIHFL